MPELTNLRGLEQSRAKFAYECAKEAAAATNGKEYKSYAKKFPMMIKTNGLGAALAFAFSKKKPGNAWERIYNNLELWIKSPGKVYLIGKFSDKTLADSAIALDSQDYRCLTVEILAFLTWLRRFAEGLIEGDADETV